MAEADQTDRFTSQVSCLGQKTLCSPQQRDGTLHPKTGLISESDGAIFF